MQMPRVFLRYRGRFHLEGCVLDAHPMVRAYAFLQLGEGFNGVTVGEAGIVEDDVAGEGW